VLKKIMFADCGASAPQSSENYKPKAINEKYLINYEFLVFCTNEIFFTSFFG